MYHGMKLDGTVVLVLTDPPYLTRSEEQRPKYEELFITDEEIVVLEGVVDDVL